MTAIDPAARSVTTDAGDFDADVLVIALGADYDVDATPGLATAGDEFYSVAGAERLGGKLPGFTSGHAVGGICGRGTRGPRSGQAAADPAGRRSTASRISAAVGSASASTGMSAGGRPW